MSQLDHDLRVRMATAISNASNTHATTDMERSMHKINWKEFIYLLSLKRLYPQIQTFVTLLKPYRMS